MRSTTPAGRWQSVQPPTMTEMVREELTAWDSVMRQAFRQPPYNPDELIGQKSYDIYERMMTDAQIRASINTKRYALLSRPWSVLANGPDGPAEEAREFIDYALQRLVGPDGATLNFRHALFEMMSAFYRGFSLAEMVWQVEEQGRWRGKYTLKYLKFKHPKQIGFEMDEFLNIRWITSWTPEGGLVRVPRSKCVLYTHNPKDELPYGESDLRAVYKHWWSKDALIKMWNLMLQRHGIPMVYAQSPAANETTTRKLLQVLKSIQQDSTAIFPRDVAPQLLQTTPGGDAAFLNAVEWHNQQIATGILLQTLTSTEGRRSGSLALGLVHYDILLYALDFAKADIEAVVNSQIVTPLMRVNFPTGPAPHFTLGPVSERDLLQLAQAYSLLIQNGVVDGKDEAVRKLFQVPPER